MLKRSAPGLTALFTASLQTDAQVPGARALDRLTAALPSARIDLIKAAPTDDREKPLTR
jgi:hypothetical protein